MKPKINRALLLKIKAQILKEPDQFVMEALFSHFNEAGELAPNCGTAACIGGWAVCLSKKINPLLARKQYMGKNIGAYIEAWVLARKALGLDEEQAQNLFEDCNWPAPFSINFDKARTMKTKARIAAKRIDWFLKHGK